MGNHVVSSILQQLLQNRSLLPLMVAEEMQDAEYKNRQGAYRGREDPSSGGGGPVAELTRLPPGYPALLEELKTRIRSAQLRSALTLNQETIRLYWSIGQDLSSRFAAEGWGTKVVDRLAKDLGTEFPGVEGFSLRNLRYMRSFAEAWPDPQILQLAAKLPWGHHMVLLYRLTA
jgi:hypothetical protein